MRIGFLLNHYESHQVPHVVPFAFKLSELYPDIKVIIMSSTLEQQDFAKDIAAHYPNHCCQFKMISASRLVKLIDPILSQWFFIRKSAVIRNNILWLSTFDSIVVPELTSLTLKKYASFRDVKLIFTVHGAGDNENYPPFDKRLKQFDLCLVPGKKYAEIVTRRKLVTPNGYAISGYPKFEAVAPFGKNRSQFFKNNNPTIIYNPHHHPDHSSWPLLGEKILDFFYTHKGYNLIFAPHVLLFKRKLGRGASLPKKYRNQENIILDLGSRSSIDMTYMNMADIYFGDSSSQIYEFLKRPRPCVFFDTLSSRSDSDVPYFNWNFGPVVKNGENIEKTIALALTTHSKFLPIQRESFANTFEISTITAAERGAHIIEAFSRTGTVDPKWQ
jgi:CDP-glycerol glycerophosphotransferase (TagB/SpsB family)